MRAQDSMPAFSGSLPLLCCMTGMPEDSLPGGLPPQGSAPQESAEHFSALSNSLQRVTVPFLPQGHSNRVTKP